MQGRSNFRNTEVMSKSPLTQKNTKNKVSNFKSFRFLLYCLLILFLNIKISILL